MVKIVRKVDDVKSEDYEEEYGLFPDGPERRIAIEILNEFEELLNEKNITIPSDDREGGDEEARLFGSEYFVLEDRIVEILKASKNGAGVMRTS